MVTEKDIVAYECVGLIQFLVEQMEQSPRNSDEINSLIRRRLWEKAGRIKEVFASEPPGSAIDNVMKLAGRGYTDQQHNDYVFGDRS